MNVLDLFSGIGGFSLGLERAGMKTIAMCEYDDHARKVLAKHWPEIKIHKDVRELDGKQYRGTVDLVCGGFPCQDLSSAGKKAGFTGERSSLYKEMLRIISECGPRYAIFENVTGLLTGEQGRWFAQFLYDLAEIGYDAEWHCIEAAYVGAPHRRDRVWVIAYPNSECQQGRTKRSNLIKQQAWRVNSDIQNFPRLPNPNESPLLRVDDGISGRLDRSDARKRSARLGNSVVPQIPELIGKALMEFEKDNA